MNRTMKVSTTIRTIASCCLLTWIACCISIYSIEACGGKKLYADAVTNATKNSSFAKASPGNLGSHLVVCSHGLLVVSIYYTIEACAGKQ